MNRHTMAVVGLMLFTLLAALGGSAGAAPPGPEDDPSLPEAALGTAFTYAGRLQRSGAPFTGSCNLEFRLYNAANAGAQVGGLVSLAAVPVTAGLFTVALDFGGGVFNGDARWLGIAVKCGSDPAFAALAPRQPLTAAPYAFALPSLHTEQNATSPNIIGGYSGNSVTPGTVGAVIAGGGQQTETNSVTGVFGTVSGGYNNTAGGVGTVSGGANNIASGNSATVSGGANNTASGGEATVGGGVNNTASAFGAATVSGGSFNTASRPGATVGGGGSNTASGDSATVPGGANNEAKGAVSLAAGQNAHAMHDATFVWADGADFIGSGVPFTSTGVNQFLIRAGNGVGIGTNRPMAQLNIASDGNALFPQVHISQTMPGDYARLRFSVAGIIPAWDISAGGSPNTLNFYESSVGNIMTLKPADATNLLVMSNGASLTNGGTWTNSSDRSLKANFAPVDGRDVLAQVSQLPMQSWNYLAEDPAVRHIGPMAQDFYAAFQVGADDTHITTVDEGGVALAAIQGLNQVVEDNAAQGAAQQAQINALQARLSAMERQSPAPAATVPMVWLLFGGLLLLNVGGLLGYALARRRRA